MNTQKLAMEALGTFFLVLTAATSGNPLAIGLVLAIMVYIGGNISGGHYNPAVSLAVYLRGKLPMSLLLPYVIAQLVGGFAAALIAWLIDHKATHIGVANGWGYVPGAIFSEFLYTFLLALVVLTVATTKKHANNQYYGLCIGGTVIVAASAVGDISGGAFNPAVGLSFSIFGLFTPERAAIQYFWIYLIFPLLGGFCAAYAFNFLHPDEAEAMPSLPGVAKPAPAQEPLAQQPDVTVTKQP